MFSFLMPLLAAAAFGTPPPVKAMAPPEEAGIVWSATRRLTIADFKGRPQPGERLAALTASDIKAGASCRDFVFTGTVEATFSPSGSWFRNPATASEALLRHEQLHFDITEVYARKLRQKLAAFQVKVDCNKLQPAFNNLTKAVYAEWGKEQNQYDQQSNHGLNAAQQANWERQTQLKLEQLKAFAI